MSGAVGILGGTFDPVHEGHLHVASSVRAAVGLPVIYLLPCAVPPHKPGPSASDAQRLAMLRLAVAGRDGLDVCTWEIDRGGTNYTIDTLRALRRERGWDPVFLVGSDSLAEIPTWKEPRALLAEFDLVAVERPGAALGATATGVRPWTGSPDLGRGGRVYRLEVEPLDVSASEIRRRCAAREPLGDLVPPAVGRYIRERSLYSVEAAS